MDFTDEEDLLPPLLMVDDILQYTKKDISSSFETAVSRRKEQNRKAARLSKIEKGQSRQRASRTNQCSFLVSGTYSTCNEGAKACCSVREGSNTAFPFVTTSGSPISNTESCSAFFHPLVKPQLNPM